MSGVSVPGAPPPLAFGTWVGGDMDGNPAPGPPRSTRRSTEPARSRSAGTAMRYVRSRSRSPLRGRWSRSRHELDESLASDERELPAYAAEIGARNTLEPYRRKLSFMWWRLGNDGYATAEELLDDLAVISRSLEANGGRRVAAGRVARLQRMVETFGFHVAKLDIRLHARELGSPAPGSGRRRRGGAEAARSAALDTLIVSGTGSADDVVRALDLTSEPLAVVPLFETVDDLDARRRSSASSSPTSATRASGARRRAPR